MSDPDRHERLIRTLSAGLRPVRRLPAPWARAALWLLGAGGLAAAVSIPFGAQAIVERLADGMGDRVEFAAAILTAASAAMATFALAVPGRRRQWALLPLAPLAVWLGASGVGCWTTMTTGRDLAQAPDPAGCFRFIVATSLPLAALLFLMLRRGYCVHRRTAATLAGLAAASAAAVLLDLHHPDTLTLVDLAAHAGAIALVVAISRAVLPRALRPT